MKLLLFFAIVNICFLFVESNRCVKDYSKKPPAALIGKVIGECREIASHLPHEHKASCMDACKMYFLAESYPLCDNVGNSQKVCQDTCESFAHACNLSSKCSELPSHSCTRGPLHFEANVDQFRTDNPMFGRSGAYMPDRAILLKDLQMMARFGETRNELVAFSGSVPVKVQHNFYCYDYKSLQGIPCNSFNKTTTPTCGYYDTITPALNPHIEISGITAYQLCLALTNAAYNQKLPVSSFLQYQIPVCQDPFGGVVPCIDVEPQRGDVCKALVFASLSCYNNAKCCSYYQNAFNNGALPKADSMSFNLF